MSPLTCGSFGDVELPAALHKRKMTIMKEKYVAAIHTSMLDCFVKGKTNEFLFLVASERS